MLLHFSQGFLMDEIVKYHNDFNKLQIGKFSELEQNLLFGILAHCRYKYDAFRFTLDDLNRFSASRQYTANEMLQKAVKLHDNIFKLDFSIIKSENETTHTHKFFNLFSTFDVFYTGKKNDLANSELRYIELKVNEDFRDLIANLTKDFTQYELEEFIFLNSRYTKTIYRYLKQFRTNGVWLVSLNNFREILAIPECYKMCDIDKRIIKPAVEQLSEPLNLFETARIPFEKLEVKKLKKGGRGRGGVITHLEFTFKPQPASVLEARQAELNAQKAKQIQAQPQAQEPHYIKKLRELCADKAIFLLNDKFYYLTRIMGITENNNKYAINLEINLLQQVLKNDVPYGVFSFCYTLNDDGQALDLIKACEHYEKNKKNLEKKLLEQIR